MMYYSLRKAWRYQKWYSETKTTENTMAKRKSTKRKNNDLQNITQKTKDWKSQTLLKTEANPGAPGVKAVPVPLVASVVLLLTHTNIIWYNNHVGHQYT
jgi:hypothetical protein